MTSTDVDPQRRNLLVISETRSKAPADKGATGRATAANSMGIGRALLPGAHGEEYCYLGTDAGSPVGFSSTGTTGIPLLSLPSRIALSGNLLKVPQKLRNMAYTVCKSIQRDIANVEIWLRPGL